MLQKRQLEKKASIDCTGNDEAQAWERHASTRRSIEKRQAVFFLPNFLDYRANQKDSDDT
jgi:hypothetical protein